MLPRRSAPVGILDRGQPRRVVDPLGLLGRFRESSREAGSHAEEVGASPDPVVDLRCEDANRLERDEVDDVDLAANRAVRDPQRVRQTHDVPGRLHARLEPARQHGVQILVVEVMSTSPTIPRRCSRNSARSDSRSGSGSSKGTCTIFSR